MLRRHATPYMAWQEMPPLRHMLTPFRHTCRRHYADISDIAVIRFRRLLEPPLALPPLPAAGRSLRHAAAFTRRRTAVIIAFVTTISTRHYAIFISRFRCRHAHYLHVIIYCHALDADVNIAIDARHAATQPHASHAFTI